MSDEDRRHATHALVTLRRRIDEHFEAARARSPGAMQCGPGCHSCCAPGLTVFTIEADRVRAALRELAGRDPQTRARLRERARGPEDDRCSLLLDGRCSVYDARPIVCRSHGLPCRLPDGSVAGCELNFTDVDPPTPSVLDLAAVDRPLAVMAQMYAASGSRVPLRDLAAADED